MKSLRTLAISALAAALLRAGAPVAQDDADRRAAVGMGGELRRAVVRSRARSRRSMPILSPQTVPAMEQAIYAYQDLVARGGWPSVPADMELRIGMRDPRVVELRRRLIASGDLRQTSGDPSAFDSYVQAAVKQFQQRHGMPGDGVVGAGTLQALNVPALCAAGAAARPMSSASRRWACRTSATSWSTSRRADRGGGERRRRLAPHRGRRQGRPADAAPDEQASTRSASTRSGRCRLPSSRRT